MWSSFDKNSGCLRFWLSTVWCSKLREWKVISSMHAYMSVVDLGKLYTQMINKYLLLLLHAIEKYK